MDMPRRLAAETLGTAMLLVAVVGSGIMGERLSDGNVAVALLANALATGAVLVVLITILGPLSGAHFNPCVSLFFALRGEMSVGSALAYAAVQIPAAVLGVWLTHVMFGLPILEISRHARSGVPQMLSEFIATFGLLATIAGGLRFAPASVPMLVGLYITGAYWFTASTSFANPAVTLARSLTDSFAGIAPSSVAGFLMGQFAAVALGWLGLSWLFGSERTVSPAH
jgi:glycerol uptake facilitator-like aquaporin